MNRSELLSLFRQALLPQESWTHRAHLMVALSYLREMSAPQALTKLRGEIQQLNLFHGVYTTKERGYHETRTRVWLAVLADALRDARILDEELIERFSRTDVARDFYTLETLNSWSARVGWVEPDLKALPIDPGPWCPDTPELFTYPPEDAE